MTDQRAGGRRTSIALAIIATCQLMIILDSTVVTVALPHIQRALGFSPTGLSWVLNAYTLAFGGLLLLGGRMGDLLGRRRVFAGGVALFSAASLLGGLAGSPATLLSARALQGIGAAAAAPSVLALVMTNFREGASRNRALALVTAVAAAGASVGLILGGALTSWASWRWTLFINVPIGAAVLALTPRYLDESERRRGEFDALGALGSTIGVGALVYGFIRVAQDGWGAPVALVSFAVALVVLAGFVRREARVPQPLLPLRLLAGRNAAGGYAVMLLLPAALMGMFFFLTQFLQRVLGASALTTGLAFLPLTALLFTVSQLVPAWLPRYGPKPFLVAGVTAIIGGLAWLTRLTAGSAYAADLLGPMALFGIGAGLAFMPLSMLILSGARERDSGAASGLLNAMQQLGGTLGLAILVTVFGTSSGGSPVDGMVAAFRAATVFGLVALGLVLIAVRTPRAIREPALEAG
jgi:EmrB/QacA subfamily drug resistance transporter